MKALNFLEWYFTQKGNYRWYDNQNEFINHTYKVLDFYNRPFSMDMLVNPIKDKYYESQDMMRVTVISDKWSQHESLRLFEGWELKDENIININRPIYYITQNSRGLRFCSASLGLMYFNTLNDFITLCNLSDIELQFNESNETIRNLFWGLKK